LNAGGHRHKQPLYLADAGDTVSPARRTIQFQANACFSPRQKSPNPTQSDSCHKLSFDFVFAFDCKFPGDILFIRKICNQILVETTLDGTNMTIVVMQGNRQEVENEEYRQRMLVNALATVAITFMIVTGYWVVSTLAETMAH
jgi:hypothetical protein